VTAARYKPILEPLGPHFASIIPTWSAPMTGRLADDVGEYTIARSIDARTGCSSSTSSGTIAGYGDSIRCKGGSARARGGGARSPCTLARVLARRPVLPSSSAWRSACTACGGERTYTAKPIAARIVDADTGRRSRA